MTSIKELLFRKKEEEESPIIPLSMINLETANIENIKKALTTTNLTELYSRLDALKLYAMKMHTIRKPIETAQERVKRQKKIRDIIQCFQAEITDRNKLKKVKQSKENIAWNKENVPRMLNDLRYAIHSYNHLRQGLDRLTDLKWIKPQSEIIEFKSNTGRTIKFSLINRISTNILKRIMNSQLNPIFLRIESSPTGRIRNGKPVMLVRDSNEGYSGEQKIKEFTETYLGLMKV